MECRELCSTQSPSYSGHHDLPYSGLYSSYNLAQTYCLFRSMLLGPCIMSHILRTPAGLHCFNGYITLSLRNDCSGSVSCWIPGTRLSRGALAQRITMCPGDVSRESNNRRRNLRGSRWTYVDLILDMRKYKHVLLLCAA